MPIDVGCVDVSMDGIQLQDREFVAATREGRGPEVFLARVMPCHRTLAELETQPASQRLPQPPGGAGRASAEAGRPEHGPGGRW
ncbi:hypothetical protein ACFCXS_16395 [Streptomyces sp. NPDC056373]|uniref:hypothetical protein n=1 Tax=Streptomyces sp. NPDC056373 TaxID=3345798 RepID=UPI0035D93CAE